MVPIGGLLFTLIRINQYILPWLINTINIFSHLLARVLQESSGISEEFAAELAFYCGLRGYGANYQCCEVSSVVVVLTAYVEVIWVRCWVDGRGTAPVVAVSLTGSAHHQGERCP